MDSPHDHPAISALGLALSISELVIGVLSLTQALFATVILLLTVAHCRQAFNVLWVSRVVILLTVILADISLLFSLRYIFTLLDMVIHGDGNSGGIFTDAVVGWFCRAHSVLYYGWGQTMMTSVLAFSLMYKIKGGLKRLQPAEEDVVAHHGDNDNSADTGKSGGDNGEKSVMHQTESAAERSEATLLDSMTAPVLWNNMRILWPACAIALSFTILQLIAVTLDLLYALFIKQPLAELNLPLDIGSLFQLFNPHSGRCSVPASSLIITAVYYTIFIVLFNVANGRLVKSVKNGNMRRRLIRLQVLISLLVAITLLIKAMDVVAAMFPIVAVASHALILLTFVVDLVVSTIIIIGYILNPVVAIMRANQWKKRVMKERAYTVIGLSNRSRFSGDNTFESHDPTPRVKALSIPQMTDAVKPAPAVAKVQQYNTKRMLSISEVDLGLKFDDKENDEDDDDSWG